MDAIRLGRILRGPRQWRIRLRVIVQVAALPLGGSVIILTLFATDNPVLAKQC